VPVHERHLILVLEIAHGAKAANDHAHPRLSREVDEQALKVPNLHPGIIFDCRENERGSLLGGEERLFRHVRRDREGKDDDTTKTNKQIYGLPVLGVIASMERVAAERRVDEVVIAIPTAGGRTVRAVVELCQSIGLPSKVLPGIYELLDGQLSVNRLRKVDIADLLRRPQVHTTDTGVQYLRGACVLVAMEAH